MISRVAYLSMHTCPLRLPGRDDAGGMNVYILELARTMAERGIETDVFTRRSDEETATEVEVVPGFRVIHLPAGPPAEMAIGDQPPFVAEFAEGVVKWAYAGGRPYDLVHSHYWLSGWAGVLVKEALGIPLANSFHTLGRVKDLSRRADEPASTAMRLMAEDEVIARSDCVIGSTPHEAEVLLEHYRAHPERLCVSPPGVDHRVFSPADRAGARHRLGFGPGPVALYVGRIQPHKAVDVAVRAVAMLADTRLVVVGGPSGSSGTAELAGLHRLAGDLGIADRVEFIPPQPHDQLADLYRAAHVLVVPSRSESFGLVAAEAQACGLPVVAARVGGLAYVVEDGASGYLIDGWDPADFASAIGRVVGDPARAQRLSAGAIEKARRFSWPATADRLLELYTGITSDA